MKKKKHIHNKPWLDCPACVDWVTSPLPRIVPYPQTPIEKQKEKIMEKVIDHEFALIRKSKVLKTPWGTLIWSPSSPPPSKKENEV